MVRSVEVEVGEVPGLGVPLHVVKVGGWCGVVPKICIINATREAQEQSRMMIAVDPQKIPTNQPHAHQVSYKTLVPLDIIRRWHGMEWNG